LTLAVTQDSLKDIWIMPIVKSKDKQEKRHG